MPFICFNAITDAFCCQTDLPWVSCDRKLVCPNGSGLNRWRCNVSSQLLLADCFSWGDLVVCISHWSFIQYVCLMSAAWNPYIFGLVTCILAISVMSVSVTVYFSFFVSGDLYFLVATGFPTNKLSHFFPFLYYYVLMKK